MEELETEAVIKRDRERLTQAREEAEQRIQAAQQDLAEIARKFKAIEAFEAALRDGQEPARPTKRVRAKPSPLKTGRASRGERQQQLYAIIRDHPGITASGIVGQLGAEGKEGAAIRAALFKKAGRIVARSRWDGLFPVLFQPHGPAGAKVVKSDLSQPTPAYFSRNALAT